MEINERRTENMKEKMYEKNSIKMETVLMMSRYKCENEIRPGVICNAHMSYRKMPQICDHCLTWSGGSGTDSDPNSRSSQDHESDTWIEDSYDY